MTHNMISAQASINGSPFCPAEIRHDQHVEYIRDETAVKPDPAWEHADSNGHFHAFTAGGETPTLTTYFVHVDCDGSCGGICEGEGYDQTHWKCVICKDEVKPQYIPDLDAQTTGTPVPTFQEMTVTVHGKGPLPPVGQHDNGDGTITLTAGPRQVTIRVRTGNSELIGTGYVTLELAYRRGGIEWVATISGPPLKPRLASPQPGLRP